MLLGTKHGRGWDPSHRKKNGWQSTMPSVTRAPCLKMPLFVAMPRRRMAHEERDSKVSDGSIVPAAG